VKKTAKPLLHVRADRSAHMVMLSIEGTTKTTLPLFERQPNLEAAIHHLHKSLDLLKQLVRILAARA